MPKELIEYEVPEEECSGTEKCDKDRIRKIIKEVQTTPFAGLVLPGLLSSGPTIINEEMNACSTLLEVAMAFSMIDIFSDNFT